jgi:hypothetical protein
MASRLVFECHAEKVTLAPDHAAQTHGAETVERNAEFGRHDTQTVQPNAGAEIGRVADATRLDAVLAGEEHQYVAIDSGAGDGAAFDIASGLLHFLKHRHYSPVSRENKAAGREYDRPTALPCGSGSRAISGCRHATAFA